MKVYLIFRQGVYRHECGGVFISQETANNVAQRYLNGEHDAYHTYQVVPFKLDMPLIQDETGALNEADAVSNWERSK